MVYYNVLFHPKAGEEVDQLEYRKWFLTTELIEKITQEK